MVGLLGVRTRSIHLLGKLLLCAKLISSGLVQLAGILAATQVKKFVYINRVELMCVLLLAGVVWPSSWLKKLIRCFLDFLWQYGFWLLLLFRAMHCCIDTIVFRVLSLVGKLGLVSFLDVKHFNHNGRCRFSWSGLILFSMDWLTISLRMQGMTAIGASDMGRNIRVLRLLKLLMLLLIDNVLNHWWVFVFANWWSERERARGQWRWLLLLS